MRGASLRPQDFRVSTPITTLVIHRLSDRGNKWVGLVSSVGRLDDGTKAGGKGTKRRGFAKGRRTAGWMEEGSPNAGDGEGKSRRNSAWVEKSRAIPQSFGPLPSSWLAFYGPDAMRCTGKTP